MASCTESFFDYRGSKVFLRRGGAGAPLLFLHGAGGIPGWPPFLDKLSDRFDVIAPDHPTFGRSDEPGWVEEVADLAYFYLDFMAAQGLDAVPRGRPVARRLDRPRDGGARRLPDRHADAGRLRRHPRQGPAGGRHLHHGRGGARPRPLRRRGAHPGAAVDGVERGTAGRRHQEQGRHRPARLAAAAVQPAAAQMAAPDRRADPCGLGGGRQGDPPRLRRRVPEADRRGPA